MTAGEKIRRRRLELGMTMDDLGRSIGVQRSAINKYEKGFVSIKSSTLVKIARVLNVPPVALLDDIPGSAGYPGVVIPDTSLYVEATSVMTAEEMATLTDIFARAFRRLEETHGRNQKG